MVSGSLRLKTEAAELKTEAAEELGGGGGGGPPPSAAPGVCGAGDKAAEAVGGLVGLALTAGSKRKRLQVRSNVTVGQLVERYQGIVHGDGVAVMADPSGFELGSDLTVGLLAAERAAAGHVPPLELCFQMAEW
eukprot:CAMPEP_0204161062 /NCGR_PEP_ID=MMETSP0361-20130328/34415_1 /ASSEMBLY_ACC=CAM_ASM_000343 /TAXON_ID=268821 /ORGANISM="Scrippsiella Hangoei, Strain SHTV-5" /LENGTH=133 /DNA_ID=CAMNT_0051117433 /DNA_START=93 /DNA_END=494 /DNA_ORIENTATION=-